MTIGESDPTSTTSHQCTHESVNCLNQFEIIRKYRCASCGEIMMCACDEEFGTQFLPHQLASGTELSTRNKVRVTAGFIPNICNSCRGHREDPHPKAKSRWSGSLIERYYWREIQVQTIRRYATWSQAKFGSYRVNDPHDRTEWERVQREVVEQIRVEHERAPKYDLRHGRQAPSNVLIEHGITQVDLKATYAEPEGNRARVIDEGKPVSVEDFATAYFERDGSTVVFCESRVIHAVFGTFMWLLINDPLDPNSKMVMFGRPRPDEVPGNDTVWMQFPLDFGAKHYAQRRADAIEAHFSFLNDNAGGAAWLFDYWQAPSLDLRRYLHAATPDIATRARQIIELLPWDVVLAILRYLVGDYWGRYLGWPDLLVSKNGAFRFVEVKSSKDALHPNQRRWITDNATILRMPFVVVKLHRANPRSNRGHRVVRLTHAPD